MKNYLKPISMTFMAAVLCVSSAQAGIGDIFNPGKLGKKISDSFRPSRRTQNNGVKTPVAPMRNYGVATPAPQVLNQAILTALAENRTQIGQTAIDLQNLRAIYDLHGNRAFWTNENGLSNMGLALQDMLSGMSTLHGFEPQYYLTADVEERLIGGDWNSLAELDILLTQGYMLFAKDLATGRINPRDPSQGLQDIEFKKNATPSLTLLNSITSTPEALFDGVDRMAPDVAGYRFLVESLAKINDGIHAGGWAPLDTRVYLGRGDVHYNVIGLRQRLVDFGYLSPTERSNPNQRFDNQLEAALKRFQQYNLLDVDGSVGPQVYQIMAQPVEKIKNQIRANLEKWRFYPRHLPQRYLMVDMGRQQMDVIENNQLVMRMNTVVGGELTSTPSMSDQVTQITFAPYWTSPNSIVINETIPAFKTDVSPAAYLKKRNVEILPYGKAPLSDSEINGINWSQYTLKNPPPYLFRQKTGEGNALGLVKFHLTNGHSIYLHDTNNKAAFGKRVRYLSHGCIRLAKPFQLAAYLLYGTRGEDSLNAQAEVLRNDALVSLDKKVPIGPVPVYIFGTTTVNYPNGEIGFGVDIYKQDERIIRALDQMANPVSAVRAMARPE